MILPLSDLKPSPWNPKRALTKKQEAALKKGVEKFGFMRSLCVCRDFRTGEGFIVLDGNTALDLLHELGKTEIDCHIVEKVTDETTMKQFMAGYSINKTPLYSEFALELGELDFSDFTGLDFSKFSFDIKIDSTPLDFGNNTAPENEEDENPPEDDDVPAPREIPQESRPEPQSYGGRQSQYFLTLPYDTVDKLRNFCKSKAYNTNKTKAIAEKIDAMNDKQFLENILQIVL